MNKELERIIAAERHVSIIPDDVQKFVEDVSITMAVVRIALGINSYSIASREIREFNDRWTEI